MKVCSVWYGANLSYLEALSLKSALSVGHEVELYVYEHVNGIPDGVKVCDANDVMPKRLMIADEKTGSFALGADIFRLLLQKQSRGCYIDCDMVLLRPLPDDPLLCGWESGKAINNAVLRLPPDSPLLADMLALAFSTPVVPPWMPWEKRWKQRRRWLLGKHLPLERMPWATIGPRALTYYMRKRGLLGQAKAREVFYPVQCESAADLFTPGADLGITSDTIGVHLWHSQIRMAQHLEPLEGSWLREQCRRLGVTDPRWATAREPLAA